MINIKKIEFLFNCGNIIIKIIKIKNIYFFLSLSMVSVRILGVQREICTPSKGPTGSCLRSKVRKVITKRVHFVELEIFRSTLLRRVLLGYWSSCWTEVSHLGSIYDNDNDAHEHPMTQEHCSDWHCVFSTEVNNQLWSWIYKNVLPINFHIPPTFALWLQKGEEKPLISKKIISLQKWI